MSWCQTCCCSVAAVCSAAVCAAAVCAAAVTSVMMLLQKAVNSAAAVCSVPAVCLCAAFIVSLNRFWLHGGMEACNMPAAWAMLCGLMFGAS